MTRPYALLAVALLCAGLTIWALWERSGRLACLVKIETLTWQLALLGQQVNEQNLKVRELKEASAAARKRGAEALSKAEARADTHRGEIAALEARIRAGSTAACPAGEAVKEIRGQ